ncbi:hypothetical protein [Streptomyces sp. NPDC127112]|uniref:hypothetical protein n=1 Tax=Streptomyces sp. NPDC127112 TaxID=3345364 RepID=UPI003637073F
MTEPQQFYGDASPTHLPPAMVSQRYEDNSTLKARMELRAEAIRLAARVIKDGGQTPTLDAAMELATWLLGEAA